MKTLTIIRHAKSSWSDQSVNDHDRRLNDRGREDASKMGKFFHLSGISLGVVYCSTARRAVKTLQRISKNVQLDETEIHFLEELYTFDLDDLLAVIKGWSNDIDTASIVGHNPALTDLINYLTNESLENLPTAGVMILQLSIEDWSGISPSCGRKVAFFSPKMFLVN